MDMQELNHFIDWFDSVLEQVDLDEFDTISLRLPVEDVRNLRDFLVAYRKKSIDEYVRAIS